MSDLSKLAASLFEGWGITSTATYYLTAIVIFLLVALLAIVANFVAKGIILKALSAVIKKTQSQWDDLLLKRKVFLRLSHIAPALVFYFCADFLFPSEEVLQALIRRLAVSYTIFVGLLVFDALLEVVNDYYQTLKISVERPIRSYVQVVKIIAYFLGAIVILGTLMDRSPMIFLSGLGAMTAVILLVFKDSILGLVASIQLSAQNMVQIGDWIEIPKYGADGDVIEINLNTVKVQNFDKTISTIPTYALISDSFRNWRGMSESGGRRIKRSFNINMNSIKFCTGEMLERFKKTTLIAPYIETKQKEIEQYHEEKKINPDFDLHSRRLTNIGTFRKYIVEYLRHHPLIHKEMTLLVRQLPPSSNGLPIEIYAFSSDTAWGNYEDIQADIFDHLLAIIPEFDLAVFQNPAGADFRSLGNAA